MTRKQIAHRIRKDVCLSHEIAEKLGEGISPANIRRWRSNPESMSNPARLMFVWYFRFNDKSKRI